MLRLTSQRLVQGKSLVTPVWKGLVVDFSTEKKVSKPSGGAKGKKAAGGDDKKHETQALNQFYMVSEKART